MAHLLDKPKKHSATVERAIEGFLKHLSKQFGYTRSGNTVFVRWHEEGDDWNHEMELVMVKVLTPAEQAKREKEIRAREKRREVLERKYGRELAGDLYWLATGETPE